MGERSHTYTRAYTHKITLYIKCYPFTSCITIEGLRCESFIGYFIRLSVPSLANTSDIEFMWILIRISCQARPRYAIIFRKVSMRELMHSCSIASWRVTCLQLPGKVNDFQNFCIFQKFFKSWQFTKFVYTL